jgi:hypothetical protein
MSQQQANAVAKIALAMPDEITTRDVLIALNHAYRAGFEHGSEAALRHHAQVLDAVSDIINGQKRDYETP